MTVTHVDPRTQPLRLAVLLSGGGRTLQNLGEAIATGRLHARIDLVISSRTGVQGIQRAANLGLTAVIVPRKQYNTPAEFSDVIWQHIRQAEVDMVVLAGFLSWIAIPNDFQHRVVNIHPALLPAFGGEGMYGHHVHEAVLAHGCKVSGCTVHFCDQTYDTGPILVQRTCPVLDDDTADTLAARVFEQECLAYLETAQTLAQRRVLTVGRRTFLLPDGDLLTRARAACVVAHRGQSRDGGGPYADHPQAVADILRTFGTSDPAILAAAYLHDVLEDTDVLERDLELLFGPAVSRLVREMTIPADHAQPFERKQAYLTNHAATMSEPARRIKLADRLHNVRSLGDRPAEKRGRYAQATLRLLEALRPWPTPAMGDAILAEVRPYLPS